MLVLRTLTIVYAAVLVAALATVLTFIFAYLWRIGSALSRVRASLARAAEHTRALKDARMPQPQSMNEHVRELEDAARDMIRVRDALATIVRHGRESAA